MKWFKDFVKYTVDAWNNSEQKDVVPLEILLKQWNVEE